MRHRSHGRPWDLIIALAYTLAVSVGVLLTAQGSLWAVLLLLFFPGYVVVAALFPGKGLMSHVRRLVEEGDQLCVVMRSLGVDLNGYKTEVAQATKAADTGRLSEAIRILEAANDRLRARLERRPKKGPGVPDVELPPRERREEAPGGIDWVERISLSFGLSIALVSLVGLMLAVTPFGIALESMVVSLLLLTVLVGLLAYRRRLDLPLEDRLSATIGASRPAAPAYSGLDTALAIGLAASVVFAAGVLVYAAIMPRPVEHFTQFALLDRNGTADPNLYPTDLNVSEPGTLVIRVVNNESTRTSYSLRVNLVGVEFVKNVTSGLNDTVELNRSTMYVTNFTLDIGEAWQRPYTFVVDRPGEYRLDFFLFRDGMLTEPYHELRLFVHVGAPP